MTTRVVLLSIVALGNGLFGQSPAASQAAPPKAVPSTPAAPKAAPAKPSPTPAATKAATPATAAPKPRTAAARAEAALRARVNEFFQYHVTGDFRKAIDMVAEDTKDEYFASGKARLKSFTVDSLKLTDNNTKAVATLTIKRDWQIRMQSNEVIVPMVTTWKMEKGQWYWYHDLKGAWLTPMGPSKVEPPSLNADGTLKLPKSMAPEVIAAAAQSILGQSGINRTQVTFNPEGTNTEERIMFTNGAQGSVHVGLQNVPDIPGFRAQVEKSDLRGGEQVALKLFYERPAETVAPDSFTLQIVTEPLNQVFPVRVNFEKPDAQ